VQAAKPFVYLSIYKTPHIRMNKVVNSLTLSKFTILRPKLRNKRMHGTVKNK